MMERQSNHDRVKFNVGGRIFETTSTTLANAGRNSYFGAMFDDNWNFIPKLNSITNSNQQSTSSSEHFIDRNPDCFAVLLDLLRTGTLHIPQNLPENLLYNEASFYGLTNHLRTAKWSSPIDGNRLTLSHSVTGHAPGDGTAIRASPDGGCAVAHGCMVHIYDWTLSEHPSLHLDYQIINDMLYINNNPENIIISACEKSGRGDSGMGLFSASDGKLRHKYEIYHDNQIKSYTAGALSYDLKEGYIYASCKGRSNEYGIGMWDEVTGKQVDFFYEPMGWSLGEADRLQWLDDRNCLLVATLFPRKDNCYISLVDFRVKRKMVWSWSDAGGVDEKRVRDAVAMEDSICVVNEFEDLGFMDVRSGGVNGGGGGGSVRWSSRSKLAMNRRKMVMDFEPCYPKLGFHQGQLFSSMNDCVSVFSGPDWVLTSRLRRSNGGSICDFSIGGDRLFALHSEENVFDVWETPPSI